MYPLTFIIFKDVCDVAVLTDAIWIGWESGIWVMGVAAEAEMLAPVVLLCWPADCCCTAAARIC